MKFFYAIYLVFLALVGVQALRDERRLYQYAKAYARVMGRK